MVKSRRKLSSERVIDKRINLSLNHTQGSDLMMNILEMVAGALAGKVEGDGKEAERYSVYRNLVEHQEEIRRLLPPELHEALARLGQEYSERYPEEAAVYYRQGFTDAMRLVFDCLPRREEAKPRKGE